MSDLTEKTIGLAMKVHRTLGPGFVEYVYRNALLHEFHKAAIEVETEKPMKVVYDHVVIGEFKADLLIDHWLICELKAVSALKAEHEVQLLNYLTALGQDYGLLFNFGAPSLQVKRKYRRLKTGLTEEPVSL